MVSFRSLVWFCSGDFTYQLTDYNKVNEKQRLIKKLRNMFYIYSIFYLFQIGAVFSQTNVSTYVVDITVSGVFYSSYSL